MAQFTNADLEILRGPHVARVWFLELALPSGVARYHNGVGRVTAGGHEWRGVTDPIGGQLVKVDAVQNPRFGQAAAVTVTIGGANLAFFKSMREEARNIEGMRADIYWAAFDPETEQQTLALKKLFPGRMSRPVLHRQGVGTRFITINIEDMWQAQNYPFGGKWSPGDQSRRYPGDKGLNYVGVRVQETFK